MTKEERVKKIIGMLVFMSACCAAARTETSTNQVAQIRERLIDIAHISHPRGNAYAGLEKWANYHNIPMGAVYAEIKAAALEASENMGDLEKTNSNYGWMMCANMLNLMDKSGDETFLPVIEQIGGESLDPSLRSQAVNVYIRFKGIESFALVKKAIVGLPPAAEESTNDKNALARIRIYEAFMDGLSETRQKYSGEQMEPVYDFLLAKMRAEPDIPYAVNAIDQFLAKEIPEYANSRQRRDMITAQCNKQDNWMRDTFTARKAELDKIPEAQRTDLSQRFKQAKEEAAKEK
jgi:ribosomal 50S subunit-associated protein YjgA (DUF615 family)